MSDDFRSKQKELLTSLDRHLCTFLPSESTVRVSSGTTVLQAAREAGIVMAASCAGRGTCGTCAVAVFEGHLDVPDEVEAAAIKRMGKPVRLGCRARIVLDVVVEPVIKLKAEKTPEELRVQAESAAEYEHDIKSRYQEAVMGQATYVAAVDVGTTNISLALVDTGTFEQLAVVTCPNQQASWGADILSRLSATVAGNTVELRDAGQNSVLQALIEAMNLAHISDFAALERVVISANSVMAPLFTGQDASSLATAPFSPVYGLVCNAGPLVDGLFPETTITMVEPLLGFVGGDTRSALIATGLDVPIDSGAHLLVDMGTNAEVVLRSGSDVYLASAPAGPAFEGRLRAGVRLRGSDIIKFLADLLRRSVLDETGLLNRDSSEVVLDDEGIRSVSMTNSHDLDQQPIMLSQLDIRDFQLALSAVKVVIQAVLKSARISSADLSTLSFAGAFGGALDIDDLIVLGVCAPENQHIAHEVGNASLDGAIEIALGHSPSIAGSMHLVDVAESPTFAQDLMGAMKLG